MGEPGLEFLLNLHGVKTHPHMLFSKYANASRGTALVGAVGWLNFGLPAQLLDSVLRTFAGLRVC